MNRAIINADQAGTIISRHLYGHFAEHLGRCIYGGIWAGEDSPIANTRGIRNDIVHALRAIGIPNLRWPGGCFADEYHWEDGIGPRSQRPAMLNTHWGGVVEDNSFGTHEFLDLCEQLNCEPYICGNLGSGTVREMQQWIEYITFAGKSAVTKRRRECGRERPWTLSYWGVGNENWGCGGNMRAEYYADLYRQYSTYCRNLSGNQLYRIGCGPSGADLHWTEVMMRQVFAQKPGLLQGLSLHYYCGSGADSRSATEFEEPDWFAQLARARGMDDIIRSHRAVMDRFDPKGIVGLMVDEWGAWHQVEPGTPPAFLFQQNSIRDALVAALTLHIFHDHCERVRMANIAQTVNVLQAMILTRDETMILTPTYHVFDMLRIHHDAARVPVALSTEEYRFDNQCLPGMSVSASRTNDGTLSLSVCNVSPAENAELACDLRGMSVGTLQVRMLTADTITAHNTFDNPNAIQPMHWDGISVKKNALVLEMPARSVATVTVTPA